MLFSCGQWTQKLFLLFQNVAGSIYFIPAFFQIWWNKIKIPTDYKGQGTPKTRFYPSLPLKKYNQMSRKRLKWPKWPKIDLLGGALTCHIFVKTAKIAGAVGNAPMHHGAFVKIANLRPNAPMHQELKKS